MSLSYTNLKGVKVIDPRVNISEAKNYLFKQGANVVTHRTFTATSASKSNVTFKCNPPNSNIVVSRLVYLNFKVVFKLKGTARLRQQQQADNGLGIPNRAAGDLISTDLSALVAGNGDGSQGICLRQFPIASVMRTLKVNINSDTLTVQPYRYIHALSRYNLNDDMKATIMSSSPSQQDEYQKYNDKNAGVIYRGNPAAVVANSAGKNYGLGRSPFQSIGGVAYEIPRGSYIPISIIYVQPNVAEKDSPTENYTEIIYDITEPLFISPLSGSDYNLMGLSQISTMDVDISFDSSKLSRMLSIDESTISTVAQDAAPRGLGADGNQIPGDNTANTRRLDVTNGIDIEFGTSDSKISFIYLTPQVNRPIAESLIYDYHNLYIYSKQLQSDNATLAAGGQELFESDNMSLSSIPSKVYIYAKLRDKDQSAYTSDCFANISSIDINFNGVSGILSSANEWELWRMSAANGLQMSYNQWKHYTGSVLCIDFGKNMGLGPQQCVGLLGTFDLSYRITIKNIDTLAKAYDLFTVIDSAGTFTVSNGQIVKQLGIVSSNDVLQSEEYKEMDSEYLERLYGGNFMSGLKHVYSKAQKLKPYAKKASKIARGLSDPIGEFAPRVGNVLKTGADIADSLLGQGYSAADIKKLKKMGYSNADLKKLAGGNVVGGAGYPKNKLAKRMATYR